MFSLEWLSLCFVSIAQALSHHENVEHLLLLQSQYFCVLFFLDGGYQPTRSHLFCRAPLLFTPIMVTLQCIAARVLVSYVHHKILFYKNPTSTDSYSWKFAICHHSPDRFFVC